MQFYSPMSDVFTKSIIETDRLRLAPFAPEHVAALNAINNEPDVMRFLSSGTAEKLDDTRAAIDRVRARWIRLGFGWWSIVEKTSVQIIGAACVQNIANAEDADLEIGWRLTTAATGRGFATEAGKAVADFAFDVVGADYVVAVADPDNLASHRVMQRIGMTYRGVETHYDAPCTTYVLHRADRQT